MGGMLQPIPGIGKPAGRAMVDIGTLGLAELLPNKIQDPLNNAAGSLFFSPLSGLAAGGAGMMGAGGIGAGGMGTAGTPGAAAGSTGLEGLAQFAIPGGAAPTIGPTSAASLLPAGGVTGLSEAGTGLASGAALNAPPAAAAAGTGMSGNNMLQNAFLATSVGGMLGNAIKPPPPPAMGVPNAPTGGGGSFTPVANSASQQWAQLMAQRRAQQTGKFTV